MYESVQILFCTVKQNNFPNLVTISNQCTECILSALLVRINYINYIATKIYIQVALIYYFYAKMITTF